MEKTQSRGKHYKGNDNKKIRTIVIVAVIILLLIIGTYLILSQMNGIVHEIQGPENVIENTVEEPEIQEPDSTLVVEEPDPEEDLYNIPETMGGYNVLGRIVIDKINLNNYILHTTTSSSLNLSVARYYGPKKANTAGNFCILGHNYKGLFINLKDLSIGDTFYIIDSQNKEKVTYEITQKYSVYPDELYVLDQNYDGRRLVTLITCNPRRSD